MPPFDSDHRSLSVVHPAYAPPLPLSRSRPPNPNPLPIPAPTSVVSAASNTHSYSHSASTAHDCPRTGGNVPLEPPVDVDPLVLLLRRKQAAARRIWRFYSRNRDRRIFCNMKANLAQAERLLAREILRRLSPNECELLRDPTMRPRLRFRFAGPSFPPTLLFKILLTTTATHYFSARRLIHAFSPAATDAKIIMGSRAYAETHLSHDSGGPVKFKPTIGGDNDEEDPQIRDPLDVTNRRDFQRYMAYLDALPAHLGGRGNGWRVLDGAPCGAGGQHGGRIVRMLGMEKRRFAAEVGGVGGTKARGVRSRLDGGGGQSEGKDGPGGGGKAKGAGMARNGHEPGGAQGGVGARVARVKRMYALAGARASPYDGPVTPPGTAGTTGGGTFSPHGDRSRSRLAHFGSAYTGDVDLSAEELEDMELFAWADGLDEGKAGIGGRSDEDYVVGAVVGYAYGWGGRGDGVGYLD
ncbi:hypothetical protein M427DRAFT_499016 [Gonapodya prolifera JEL478]|uniref:Uncharacterized protein n=1 Tax=Gonapodya prolifera (strain JEL478) TaxID=1344416 RepID=A0A139AVS1_GONPJ|nr:hypothetical protein M427DRAFT_499016 [Gonapodya prolifera JEL478]|eukprot:KXS20832.1 hypothetical protein M427DRAFT_499016 [Gonapodya prolifera JEL478]